MNKYIYPFNTAFTQARELYGLELNPDEFETIGLIAWGKIGNKQIKLYKYRVEPSEDEYGNFFVDLPCNIDEIEAVTADYEDYQKTSNQFLAGNTQNENVKTEDNNILSNVKPVQNEIKPSNNLLDGEEDFIN